MTNISFLTTKKNSFLSTLSLLILVMRDSSTFFNQSKRVLWLESFIRKKTIIFFVVFLSLRRKESTINHRILYCKIRNLAPWLQRECEDILLSSFTSFLIRKTYIEYDFFYWDYRVECFFFLHSIILIWWPRVFFLQV